MPSNDFAFYSKNPNSFIVQNISTPQKTIRIFHFPIPHGDARDMIAIPGVAESDIRASLLKGELRHKILAKEIVVLFSDIDLIQFNQEQLNFLTNAGITQGTKISVDGYVTQDEFDAAIEDLQQQIDAGGGGGGGPAYFLKQNIIPVGVRNGLNRTFYTPDVFTNGLHRSNTLALQLYLNGRLLIESEDYELSLTGNPGATGFNTITFTGVVPGSNSNLLASYAIGL